MGNCYVKSVDDVKASHSIRIITDFGRIIELGAPKLLVRDVLRHLNSPSGYGIFRQGHGSSPLFDDDSLFSGRFYYLLPVGINAKNGKAMDLAVATNPPNGSPSAAVEVLPPPRKGVWRVKLVIDTKDLADILSEEVNIEALIEQMRMAATSANVSPKRIKGSSWLGSSFLKPILSNAFKFHANGFPEQSSFADFSRV